MTAGQPADRYAVAFDGYRIERILDRHDDVDRLFATDYALERPVVIHVLAPDAVTPERQARFRRVARLLAQLSHPSVVSVHRGDDGLGGLDYFIVPYVGGETLEERLARGPLPRPEAGRLAADLLCGLQALHSAGIVGSELDPASIACVDGRWVLTGVGVARTAASGRFVAPEERESGTPTPRGDVYVAGLVLRQAFAAPRTPRRLRAVLQRALAAPSARWPDAPSLLAAVQQATRRPRWWRVAIPVAAAVTGLGIAWQRRAGGTPEEPVYQLAILPLAAGTEDPDSLARALSSLMQLDLDGVPGLRVAPQRQVLKLLAKQDREESGSVNRRTIGELRTEWTAQGRVDRHGSVVRVALNLTDRAGRRKPLPELAGSTDDIAAASDSLAVQLLQAVAPLRVTRYVPRPELRGVPFYALKAFLRGEEAFGRDEMSGAEGFYRQALDADSTFALAEWRLANVRRWRRRPYDSDLRALRDRPGLRLGPTDRRLLDALVEPNLRRRFAMLDSTVAAFPDDAYARLIYGEELWHRGPLVGFDVAEARRMMAAVVVVDSTLAQAYDHIIMYHIRQGESREARKAYDQMGHVTLRPSSDDPDRRRFFWLALQERFHPWVARMVHWRLEILHDSTDMVSLGQVARLGGPWFDIPDAQVALAGILLRHGSSTDSARGSARVGIALGQLAQGQVARGLAQLDSAAEGLGSTEMRLQQAEWRVIPPALGLAGWSGADAGVWIARLDDLARDPEVGARARWALAIARLGAGDTAGLVYPAAAGPDARPDPLGVLLRAVRVGASGRPDEALAITDSVRAAFEVTQPPDPFAGAVFHLFRGAWQLARGRTQAADREWLWYQASDFEGWPSAYPQAGEVDGVVGVFARWKRGELKLAAATGAADTAAGCALVRRAAELWRDADPSLLPARAAARTRAGACRS